jgi:Ca-activated chloride channel homolog
MKRWVVVTMFALGLAAAPGELRAIGRVYARLPNNIYSPIYNLRIATLSATAEIRDQLALTHVDQVFANDNNFRLEGFYIFVLPEGATVHEMYLWINGIRTPYTVKKRADAVVKYDSIVARTADPAILEQLGPNTFRLRIWPFEAHGTRRIEIVYAQPLTYYSGTIQYQFPLDMTDYTSAAIQTAGLVIHLTSQLPIAGIQTSADDTPAAVKVTKPDAHHAIVEYGLENVTFSKDFKVRCEIDRGSTSMLALTYQPPGAIESPYFVLWSALPESLNVDLGQSRSLTFVADISSSMEGERLLQTKDALLSFVGMLHDGDLFNIITFSTTTASFRPSLVRATPAVRDSARAFVSHMTALGLTNFEAALREALTENAQSDSNHASIIFLTDGLPTWGETSADSLLAAIHRWNTPSVSIFPLGVGEVADYALLKTMARQNHGVFTAIAAEDSIYLKVKDLYRLLFLPVARGITMSYGGIGAFDVFPATIPATYAGDQILATGRFDKPGSGDLSVAGKVNGIPFVIEQTVAFADTDAGFPVIAQYWGGHKIQELLDLIAVMGEQKELVDQVVALSMKYSVLTPYTAFLIVEPTATGSTGVTPVNGLPTTIALGQNYPNPFNPSTRIRYELPSELRVRLTVYDMLGRLVAVLEDGMRSAGVHEVEFDAAKLASGLYIYRLEAGAHVFVKSMMLLR